MRSEKVVLKAKTVQINFEIEYQDGSKDLVSTKKLDASQVSDVSYDGAPQLVYGVEFEDDDRNTHPFWGMCSNSIRESIRTPNSFFTLNVRLRRDPSNDTPILYTEQHIEAPSNTMVMVYDPYQDRVHISELDEETVRSRARINSEAIYFEVVLP